MAEKDLKELAEDVVKQLEITSDPISFHGNQWNSGEEALLTVYVKNPTTDYLMREVSLEASIASGPAVIRPHAERGGMLGIVAFPEWEYSLPDIGTSEKVTANIRLFAIEVDAPEDVNIKVRVKAEPVPTVSKDGGPFTEKVHPKT